MRIQKLMKLHRLLNAAGEGGSDAGGTGSGQGAGEGAQGAGQGEGAQGAAQEPKADDKQGAKGISDSDAKLLKDAMRHKSRAKELEGELNQVKESLKQFEGIDPVKVRELLQQKQEEELRAAESRGEYDRILKQMGERHKEEAAALNAQIEAEKAAANSLQAQIAELTVGNSFAGSRFVSEDLTLTPAKARVVYGSHFEFKDGKVVGFDKPAGASDRTMLVNSSGDALSFDEALRKLVESDPDKDQLIRAKSRAGSGSSTTSKGAQQAVNKAAQAASAKLSGADKIAAGLKALANSQ